MKKIGLAIVALMLVMACKKNGGSGKQLLLSKVFTNNLLSVEYTYSLDRQPIRLDLYSTGQGQSAFAGSRTYQYENGLMSQVLFYNKNNQFIEKHVIARDASGKPTRVDRYGTDDEIDFYSVIQYDNDQHLSKFINYTTNPNKKNGESQIGTNAKGQVISLRRYSQYAVLQLFDSAHFEYDNKMLPAHWDFYEQSMTEFPADNTFLNMSVSSYYYYMPGGPPTDATHTFSEKKYNGQGYITSQKYDIQGNGLFGPFTANYDLKYEYIE